MFKKFDKLKVPSHWEQYWTKYPQGYTILEALINWVSQVDDLSDNVNKWNEYLKEFVETFDEQLAPTVRTMLQEMEQDGRLADIINVEIFNDLNAQLVQTAIHVKKFGAKGDGVTNDTQAFINALEYCKTNNNRLILNGGYYMVEEVPIPSGSVIDFTNAIVKRLPSTSHNHRVFSLYEKNNIHLINPKIIGERQEHVGTTGEWGYGIDIRDSQNITIDNPDISQCWGDGIYLGTLNNGSPMNKDIYITGTSRFKKCRRQGISIIKGENIFIDDVIAEEIDGTLPMLAVDVEANTNTDHLRNIVINSITAIKCAGAFAAISQGGELSVSVGDIYSIDCIGDYHTMFGYSEVGDASQGSSHGTQINANNWVTVNNLFVNKSYRTVARLNRNLVGTYPNVKIGSIKVGAMIYSGAHITDETFQWNVVAMIVNRNYNYKIYGNVHIGEIVVDKVINKDSIYSFIGVNRASSGFTDVTKRNVVIDKQILVDQSSAVLLQPFSAFQHLVNCDFGLKSGVTVLDTVNRRIGNGFNVAYDSAITIHQTLNHAVIHSLNHQISFTIHSSLATNYRVVLNGVNQTVGITTLSALFSMTNRLIYVNVNHNTKVIDIRFNNLDYLNTTSGLPTEGLRQGVMKWDNATSKPIWYDGTKWVTVSVTPI